MSRDGTIMPVAMVRTRPKPVRQPCNYATRKPMLVACSNLDITEVHLSNFGCPPSLNMHETTLLTTPGQSRMKPRRTDAVR